MNYTEGEIWKDIRGYEGLYQVSNKGRVKSLSYRQTGIEKLLKSANNGLGYLIVALCKNGKTATKNIHRLVALHFVEGYKEGLHVNHIDECKMNNEASNLEWITCKQNNNHGTHNKKLAITKSKPVIQCDKQGDEIARYFGANEASEQGNNFSLSDYYYAQNSGLNLSFCFEYYIKGKSEHYIAKAFLELLRVCKTLKVEFANPKGASGKGKASLESFNDQVFKCIQQLSLYNPEISEHNLKVVVLTAMLYIMDMVVDNEIKLIWIMERMQEVRTSNLKIA